MKDLLQSLIALVPNQTDSPVFPMIGEYLLNGFRIIYHLCFIAFYKTLTICFGESYWIRFMSVFGAFFTSVYFVLALIKKSLKGLIKLGLFLFVKTLRLVLGGFMDTVEAALHKAYHLFKKELGKIITWLFIKKPSEHLNEREPGHIPYFKIISNAEFEEFEKQLLKRGLVEEEFDLREQLTEVSPPFPEYKNGQVTIAFKKTGRSKTYPCGSNEAWVEEFLKDLDNKAFAN